MPSADISDVLREWPYDPKHNVRRIMTADGRESLQVRTPLGIEQYALDGRPDGLRTRGRESYLEFFLERFEKQKEGETPPKLSARNCALLHEEGVLYYFRYLLCFQEGDYERVMRDTRRNLRMFDLIHAYGEREEDKVQGDQYRPYVLRMLASATAMKLAESKEFNQAYQVLSNAIQEIERLADVPTQVFELEKERSISILRTMSSQMRKRHLPSEEEDLRRQLKAAVEAEDFERAAKLRDLLREMKAGLSGREPTSDQQEPPAASLRS
jgi:hypothetical protein